MAIDDLKKALGKEGGCNLILIAFLVFLTGYFIYWIASRGTGRDFENSQVFKDCYWRETAKYLPGDVPDFVAREQAVATCVKAQRLLD